MDDHTSENVLTQIYTTGSLAHSTTSDVKDSIKDIRVTVVEANPGIV